MNRDLSINNSEIIKENYSNPRWNSEVYKSYITNFMQRVKNKVPFFSKIFGVLKFDKVLKRYIKYLLIMKINKKLKKFFK